jgi:hypothetical protein
MPRPLAAEQILGIECPGPSLSLPVIDRSHDRFSFTSLGAGPCERNHQIGFHDRGVALATVAFHGLTNSNVYIYRVATGPLHQTNSPYLPPSLISPQDG